MTSEKPAADNPPQNEKSAALEQPKKTAPARSPIERAVVWGLIALLLAIVGWEFTAHMGYTKALRGFKEEFAKIDGGQSFTTETVNKVVGGKAPAKHEEITDGIYGQCVEEIYSWNGPIRKRGIRVLLSVGANPEVMEYDTITAGE